MREIPSSAAGDNSEGRFLMLHQPMARVVQVVALIAFTFTCVIALGTSHTAGQLAFSSDGRKLVGTVNGYTWPHPNDLLFMYGVIKIWDAGSGRTLARLAGPGTWLRALVISPTIQPSPWPVMPARSSYGILFERRGKASSRVMWLT